MFYGRARCRRRLRRKLHIHRVIHKCTALLMALVMLCTLLPQSTAAVEHGGVAGVECWPVGADVYAYLYADGRLALKGAGDTWHYANDDARRAPFYDRRGEIKEITIAADITGVGDYLFYNCARLGGALTLPAGLSAIGERAFSGDDLAVAPKFTYIYNSYAPAALVPAPAPELVPAPVPEQEAPPDEVLPPVVEEMGGGDVDMSLALSPSDFDSASTSRLDGGVADRNDFSDVSETVDDTEVEPETNDISEILDMPEGSGISTGAKLNNEADETSAPDLEGVAAPELDAEPVPDYAPEPEIPPDQDDTVDSGSLTEPESPPAREENTNSEPSDEQNTSNTDNAVVHEDYVEQEDDVAPDPGPAADNTSENQTENQTEAAPTPAPDTSMPEVSEVSGYLRVFHYFSTSNLPASNASGESLTLSADETEPLIEPSPVVNASGDSLDVVDVVDVIEPEPVIQSEPEPALTGQALGEEIFFPGQTGVYSCDRANRSFSAAAQGAGYHEITSYSIIRFANGVESDPTMSIPVPVTERCLFLPPFAATGLPWPEQSHSTYTFTGWTEDRGQGTGDRVQGTDDPVALALLRAGSFYTGQATGFTAQWNGVPRRLEQQTISAPVGEEGQIVEISGNLPVGAEVSAEVVALTAEMLGLVADATGQEEPVIYFALDICILLDGQKYQPHEYGESVTVSVKNIETPDEDMSILHIEENEATAAPEVKEVLAPDATTPDAVEFTAESFSIYVGTVTMSDEHEVFFNYEDTYGVEYCDTIDGTYVALASTAPDNVVTVAYNGTLYFKVTGSTPAAVMRDDTSIMPDPDGSGVYTVDNITADTTIVIRSSAINIISLDISYGPIVIGGGTDPDRTYTYYDNTGAQTGTHNANNYYRITGTAGTTESGGNNITLTGSGNFNVTLCDVTIYTGTSGLGEKAPFATHGVTGSGNINVNLVGTNRLVNNSGSHSNSYAALEKSDSDSTLIINGPGALNAIGGADSAGIGGSDAGNSRGATKNITINGGTIYATSQRSGGAGIGSGNNKEAGNIIINGGDITAIGVVNGAGIGGSGGESGAGAAATVTINGGTITAYSNGNGAGIGGGGSDSGVGGTGTVTITGGTLITAGFVGTGHGAGIGGGGSNGGQGGNGIVAVSGGNIVADTIGGGGSGSGIGGEATIGISGGTVEVTDIMCGGDSDSGQGGTINITISGGTVTAARISGGFSGSTNTYQPATLTITGGTVDIEDSSNITSIIDDNDEKLYLNVVFVYDVVEGVNVPVANTAVDHINITDDGTTPTPYDCNGTKTDSNGELHLWLPAGWYVLNGQAAGEPHTYELVATVTIVRTGINVDDVFTAVINTDVVAPGTSITYQWQRSITGVDQWMDIPGATSVNYTVHANDNKNFVRVRANFGGGEYYSEPVSIQAVRPAAFTVTIPETVDANADPDNWFSIRGDRRYFSRTQTLNVTVASANGYKLRQNALELVYKLYTGENQQGEVTSANPTVATFTSNGNTEVPIYYEIQDTPTYSGTYTDTLTFTVTLTDST